MNSNGQLRVTVVIPVYIEMTTIKEILSLVQAINVEKEIVIVDDGSTDGTRESLMQLSAASNRDPSSGILPPP